MVFMALTGTAAPLFPGTTDSLPAGAATRSSPGTGFPFGKRSQTKQERPLPGASIYIAGPETGRCRRYRRLFTNLTHCPPANTSSRHILSAFKTFTKTVTISGPVTADFILSDEYVEESPVVVTGLSKATQIKRSPVPIVSVTHNYLVTNPQHQRH